MDFEHFDGIVEIDETYKRISINIICIRSDWHIWQFATVKIKYVVFYTILIHIMYIKEVSSGYEEVVRKTVGLFIFWGIIFYNHFCTC